MTHCSASVPDDDPNRQRFVELEKTGAQYSAELATLRASGAFEEYSRWDAANDTLLREDPILSKGNSVGRAVAGAAGAASGFGLAVVSTPACITGVGCALPVLAGVGGAASFLDGVQATRDYFAPYEYTQGQRVADSFSSQTYPGDVNPIKDYGTTAAKYALQVALIKGAGKLAAGPGSSVLVEGVPGGGITSGTKGTVGENAIKALPAPRQIDASWSASSYKKGGVMTGIEHVFYRHGPGSGFANVSKFSKGTSVNDVSTFVDNALRYGKITPNGPGGHVIEYDAGKVIGVSISGIPTSKIKVNVRNGVIQTAFPY